MARGGGNRLSVEKKKFRGTFRKERERSSTSLPVGIVGAPPASFTKAQKAAWRELAPQVAHSFSASDRATFSLLCKLYATAQHPPRGMAPYVTAQITSRLVGLLEAFGCSPRSRRLVDAQPPSLVPGPGARDDDDDDETPLFGPGFRPKPEVSKRLDSAAAQPPVKLVE